MITDFIIFSVYAPIFCAFHGRRGMSGVLLVGHQEFHGRLPSSRARWTAATRPFDAAALSARFS
jgi:hypothetical protein